MRPGKFIAQQLGANWAIAGREVRGSRVTADGDIMKDAPFRLQPKYEVEYDGNTLTQQNDSCYFMLNKSQGYVCSTDDPDHPTTLYFLGESVAHKLYTVGHLDIDTTGLVLIVGDGQWSHRITPSRHHCKKTYPVELESLLAEGTIELFVKGIQLHSEKDLTKPVILGMITLTKVRLTVNEGCYRRVKRMFTAVGNHMVDLHREHIGDILLDDALMPSEYRSLTETEIASIGAPQVRGKT